MQDETQRLFIDQGQVIQDMAEKMRAAGGQMHLTSYEVGSERHLRNLGLPLESPNLHLMVASPNQVPPDEQAHSQQMLGMFNQSITSPIPYTQKLHAKLGLLTQRGQPQAGFVGTANLTESAHSNRQVNLTYVTQAPHVLHQLDRVMQSFQRGDTRIPLMDNVLVGSPSGNLGGEVARMIQQSRGTLTMASATFTDSSPIVKALVDKLNRGDKVQLNLGGVHTSDFESNDLFVREVLKGVKGEQNRKNLEVRRLEGAKRWHANAYYFHDSGTFVLGSARASSAGMTKNVEAMLRVNDRQAGKDLQRILDDVFVADKAPAQETLKQQLTNLESFKMLEDPYNRTLLLQRTLGSVLNETQYLIRPHVSTQVRTGIYNEIKQQYAQAGIAATPEELHASYENMSPGMARRGTYHYLYTAARLSTLKADSLHPDHPSQLFPAIPSAIQVADLAVLQMSQGERWNEVGLNLGTQVTHWVGKLLPGTQDLQNFRQVDNHSLLGSLILYKIRDFERQVYQEQVAHEQATQYAAGQIKPFDKGPIEGLVAGMLSTSHSVLMLSASYKLLLRPVYELTTEMANEATTTLLKGSQQPRGAENALKNRSAVGLGDLVSRTLGGLRAAGSISFADLFRHTTATVLTPALKAGITQELGHRLGVRGEILETRSRPVGHVLTGIRHQVLQSHQTIQGQPLHLTQTPFALVSKVLKGPDVPTKVLQQALRDDARRLSGYLYNHARSLGGAASATGWTLAMFGAVFNQVYADLAKAPRLSLDMQLDADREIRSLFEQAGVHLSPPVTAYRGGIPEAWEQAELDWRPMTVYGLGVALVARRLMGGSLKAGAVGAALGAALGVAPMARKAQYYYWDQLVRAPLATAYATGQFDQYETQLAPRLSAAFWGGLGGFFTGWMTGVKLKQGMTPFMPKVAISKLSGSAVLALAGSILGIGAGFNLTSIVTRLTGQTSFDKAVRGTDKKWQTLGNSFGASASMMNQVTELLALYEKTKNPQYLRAAELLSTKALTRSVYGSDFGAGAIGALVAQVGTPLTGVMFAGLVERTDPHGREAYQGVVGFQGPIFLQAGFSIATPLSLIRDGAGRFSYQYVPDTPLEKLTLLSAYVMPLGMGIAGVHRLRSNVQSGMSLSRATADAFRSTMKWTFAGASMVNPVGIGTWMARGAFNFASHYHSIQTTGRVNAPLGPAAKTTHQVLRNLTTMTGTVTAATLATLVAADVVVSLAGDEDDLERYENVVGVSRGIDAMWGIGASLVAGVTGSYQAIHGYRHLTQARTWRGYTSAGIGGLLVGVTGLALLNARGDLTKLTGHVWNSMVQANLGWHPETAANKSYAAQLGNMNVTDWSDPVKQSQAIAQMARQNRLPFGPNFLAKLFNLVPGKGTYFEGPNGFISVNFFGMSLSNDPELGPFFQSLFAQSPMGTGDLTLSSNVHGRSRGPGGKGLTRSDIAERIYGYTLDPTVMASRGIGRTPRVSGTMFYMDSAWHEQPPSVRIAIQQRLWMHRWMLNAHTHEIMRYMGVDVQSAITTGQREHVKLTMSHRSGDVVISRPFEKELGSLASLLKVYFGRLRQSGELWSSFNEIDGAATMGRENSATLLNEQLNRQTNLLGELGVLRFNKNHSAWKDLAAVVGGALAGVAGVLVAYKWVNRGNEALSRHPFYQMVGNQGGRLWAAVMRKGVRQEYVPFVQRASDRLGYQGGPLRNQESLKLHLDKLVRKIQEIDTLSPNPLDRAGFVRVDQKVYGIKSGFGGLGAVRGSSQWALDHAVVQIRKLLGGTWELHMQAAIQKDPTSFLRQLDELEALVTRQVTGEVAEYLKLDQGISKDIQNKLGHLRKQASALLDKKGAAHWWGMTSLSRDVEALEATLRTKAGELFGLEMRTPTSWRASFLPDQAKPTRFQMLKAVWTEWTLGGTLAQMRAKAAELQGPRRGFRIQRYDTRRSFGSNMLRVLSGKGLDPYEDAMRQINEQSVWRAYGAKTLGASAKLAVGAFKLLGLTVSALGGVGLLSTSIAMFSPEASDKDFQKTFDIFTQSLAPFMWLSGFHALGLLGTGSLTRFRQSAAVQRLVQLSQVGRAATAVQVKTGLWGTQALGLVTAARTAAVHSIGMAYTTPLGARMTSAAMLGGHWAATQTARLLTAQPWVARTLTTGAVAGRLAWAAKGSVVTNLLNTAGAIGRAANTRWAFPVFIGATVLESGWLKAVDPRLGEFRPMTRLLENLMEAPTNWSRQHLDSKQVLDRMAAGAWMGTTIGSVLGVLAGLAVGGGTVVAGAVKGAPAGVPGMAAGAASHLSAGASVFMGVMGLSTAIGAGIGTVLGTIGVAADMQRWNDRLAQSGAVALWKHLQLEDFKLKRQEPAANASAFEKAGHWFRSTGLMAAQIIAGAAVPAHMARIEMMSTSFGRGTSASAVNPLLGQISPFWIGNIFDSFSRDLEIQESVRLKGKPGASLYWMFHRQMLGVFSKGQGQEPIQQADLPLMFQHSRGTGMTGLDLARAADIASPDSMLTESVQTAITKRAILAETWALGQALRRTTDPYIMLGRKREEQDSRNWFQKTWEGAVEHVHSTWNQLTQPVPVRSELEGKTSGQVLQFFAARHIGKTDFFAEHHHPRRGRAHRGTDIGAPVGTPLHALRGGKVVWSDWASGGAGWTIVIQADNGVINKYFHNSAMLVRAGQRVKAGDVIARVGMSGGTSTGYHTHVEEWQNGRPVDPEKVYGLDQLMVRLFSQTTQTNKPADAPTATDQDKARTTAGYDLMAPANQSKSAMNVMFNQVPLAQTAQVQVLAKPEGKRMLDAFGTSAKKYGVAASLLWAVSKAESQFNPNASSWVQATGLMQIMPSTFLGKSRPSVNEVQSAVSRLKNIETNVDFGARHLRGLWAISSSWTSNETERMKLTIASYNAGQGNIQALVNRVRARTRTRDVNYDQVADEMRKIGNPQNRNSLIGQTHPYVLKVMRYLVEARTGNTTPMPEESVPTASGGSRVSSVPPRSARVTRDTEYDTARRRTDSRLPIEQWAAMIQGTVFAGQGNDPNESRMMDATDTADYTAWEKRGVDTTFSTLA